MLTVLSLHQFLFRKAFITVNDILDYDGGRQEVARVVLVKPTVTHGAFIAAFMLDNDSGLGHSGGGAK